MQTIFFPTQKNDFFLILETHWLIIWQYFVSTSKDLSHRAKKSIVVQENPVNISTKETRSNSTRQYGDNVAKTSVSEVIYITFGKLVLHLI